MDGFISTQNKLPEFHQIVTIKLMSGNIIENMNYQGNGVFNNKYLENEYYLPEVSFWKE